MVKMLNRNERKILQFFINNDKSAININQLSNLLKISVGSAHKILTDLAKNKTLDSNKFGNATLYKLSANADVVQIRALLSVDGASNKTKIIATVGPASNNSLTIKQLLFAGANVLRINGSHGDLKSHSAIIKTIKSISKTVPIMIDLPGSKIRLGDLKQDVVVKKAEPVIFTDIRYSNKYPNSIGVVCDDVHKIVKKSNQISVDDGNLCFLVEDIREEQICCKCMNSGVIQSRKGFHIPNLIIENPKITDKDMEILVFAMENDLDFIGLSFVNSASYVKQIKDIIGKNNIRIISKIETQGGLNNINDILAESYGLMIDRGDLSGETRPENIPIHQKKIIKQCNVVGKPIIIATQLLDSMITSSFPKKSEISDVANAVLDGASCLMLSAETAFGKYPVEAVTTMSNIIKTIEREIDLTDINPIKINNLTDSVTRAIKSMTDEGDISKVISITSGGYSTRMIARHKLRVPILAVTSDPKVHRQLNIIFGVIPVLLNYRLDNKLSMDQKRASVELCLEKGLISLDDEVLINGSVFPDNRKMTNLIEVHTVREFVNFFKKEDNLIEPHGGVLINRVVTNKEKALEEAKKIPQLEVTQNTLLDMSNIATGIFSPLEGFANKKEFEFIINKKRLLNGLAWTIPIVLQVTKFNGEFKSGERIALVDNKKQIKGILYFEEAFTFDFEDAAKKIYGTSDLNHPGVKKFKDDGNICLAGKIDLIDMPDPIVVGYELLPTETRKLFQERGWKTVVGFQTRNVPHRAHEYLQKAALELVDGLLIHPLIGWKKKGDYKPEAIIKGYNALIENYYPKNRVLLSALTTQMRYAGPREAVFHAIIRKNFGCSHFIIGGDHAGVGDYYGIYDAHKIFDEIGNLGITIIKLMRPYYCKKCGHIVSEKTCPHGDKYKFEVSGTRIREMLNENKLPPKELVREEVARSLGKDDLN